MARFVENPSTTDTTKPGDSKSYLEKVAKFVPAEILAAYLAVIPLTAKGEDEGSTGDPTLAWAITIVCIVMVPCYVILVTKGRAARWINSIMAVIAFTFWAYAMKWGLPELYDFYSLGWATFLLVTFTLASGVVSIPKEEPKQPDPPMPDPPKPDPSKPDPSKPKSLIEDGVNK